MTQEHFKQCPGCQNFIPEEATVCMYCNGVQPKLAKQKKPSRLKQIAVSALVIFFLCIGLTWIGSFFIDETSAPSISDASQPSGSIAQAQPTFTPPSGPTTVPTETPVPTNTPTPVPTSTPVILSGAGQQATMLFELDPGLTLVNLTHSGSGHFGVWLVDNMGNNVELLANDVGGFDGGKAFRMSNKGQYLLNVGGDGNWTVQLKQPGPDLISNRAPTTFNGQGQNYSSPVWLDEGLRRFTLSHSGDGHFGVWLLDSAGNRIDLVANEVGAVNSSKAVGVRQSGVYILDISANSSWTIVIE